MCEASAAPSASAWGPHRGRLRAWLVCHGSYRVPSLYPKAFYLPFNFLKIVLKYIRYNIYHYHHSLADIMCTYIAVQANSLCGWLFYDARDQT